MEPDDEVCLCFHVSKRKLLNFIRVEQVRRAGQLAECFGAGTGCGWCRPYLEQLFAAAAAGGRTVSDEPTPAQYAQQRARYLASGKVPAPRPETGGSGLASPKM